MKEEDKKEGLLKRLKSIEYKNEKELKAIQNKNVNLNDESVNPEKFYNEIKEMDRKIDYRRFVFAGWGKISMTFPNF